MKKVRLDQLLVSRGFVTSRNQAYAAIVTGEVSIDGQISVKPAQLVGGDANILYQPANLAYVSRGGQKLEQALDDFGVDVKGLTILDSGVSTGGFTDCLLKKDARKIIAVDVGYGQLAWKLRCDERVELHERVNVRHLTSRDISELADMATLDLSFISLKKVMPAVLGCLKEEGEVIALVKPQFEVGKGQVGKGGIVKDKSLHSEVLSSLGREFVAGNLSLLGMTWSPIVGAKGNIEYWIHLSKKPLVGYAIEGIQEAAVAVVEGAHETLK